jgi:hypothetical protein
MNEDEEKFRLRPRKPPASNSKNDSVAWTAAFKMIMHYARQSRGAQASGASGGGASRPHRQRCAVRITYPKNAIRGQWRAHGRYLERESAACGTVASDRRESSVPISSRLATWQVQKDELLWKFMISPEFRDRANIQKLTRDLMTRLEDDIGHPIEWLAVVHHGTSARACDAQRQGRQRRFASSQP